MIEMRYSGKDDKKGKCVVSVGGVVKTTGEGEQARIVALVEIAAFERTESDRKGLVEAYDDLLGKAKYGFSLQLGEDEILSKPSKTSAITPKPARYKAEIDGEVFYRGDDLQALRTEISNIPEPKFGP